MEYTNTKQELIREVDCPECSGLGYTIECFSNENGHQQHAVVCYMCDGRGSIEKYVKNYNDIKE